MAQAEQEMTMDHGGAKTSNELAAERTELAIERTAMAAGRTLMGWVRTALSMISFGFTIYKFLHAVAPNAANGMMRAQGPAPTWPFPHRAWRHKRSAGGSSVCFTARSGEPDRALIQEMKHG